MGAFALQYLLTFIQMRNFTKFYSTYRREGYRAAIGKFRGIFHAGAISMFAIDKEGTIVKGCRLQGVTNFARFKNFDKFNGYNVGFLTEELCKEKKLSYSMTKAVTDASNNYNTIMQGKEVPIPPSPFKRVANFITDGFKSVKKSIS